MEDILKQFYATVDRLANDEDYAKEVFVGRKGNPISLGPRVKSAANWVDDQIAGAKARSKRWLENSMKPKKDPQAAALAATEKYKSRLKEALDEGRWEGAVAGYDEGARMEVIKAVGTAGFERGLETHKAKAISKIAKLQPLVASVAETIDKMPQDTDADREARMIAARRLMLEVGKIMKGTKTGTPSM